MDPTGSTTGVPPTAPSSDAPHGSPKLGKDEFLKLLMAQLGNQDPTSPMDSQAFVAQLAQFASVEALDNMGPRLDAIALAQASGNQLATASLVGKEVAFKSDTVHLARTDTGPSARIGARLGADADTVTLVVTDGSGRTVRTLREGATVAGNASFAWDGLDDQGKPLPDGDYHVKVTAAKKDGSPVAVDALQRAKVTGVSFANGYAELILAGISQRVKLSDVSEINQST